MKTECERYICDFDANGVYEQGWQLRRVTFSDNSLEIWYQLGRYGEYGTLSVWLVPGTFDPAS